MSHGADDQGVRTLMQQAYGQLQEGRFEEAVETFSASLAMDPKEPQALRGRGLAHLQLKRWTAAAADFEAAKTLRPAETDNWVDLGVSLAMDDQVYPALEVFDTLLTQEPLCVRGHLEAGRLYLRIGAIPKGRHHLQQALAGRPPLAQRRLIESMLAEQDRLDRKRLYRPDFAALHQRHPGPTSGLIERVRAWMHRGRGQSRSREDA